MTYAKILTIRQIHILLWSGMDTKDIAWHASKYPNRFPFLRGITRHPRGRPEPIREYQVWNLLAAADNGANDA